MSRRSQNLRSVAILAGIASALLAFPVCAQQDLTFLTPTGQSVALSSLRGKVVLLLFAGVQDPQCRDEFKALESLVERYRDKDVGIFWVSVNPVSAVSNERLKNPCGPAGPVAVLRDPSQAAFKRFSGSVAQLPTAVVLDQQGQVHGRPRGGFNPNSDFVNDLAAVIDSLLGQKR